MLVEIIFISWSHITVKLGIVTHHCDISHPQIYDIACQFIAKILPRTQCLCDEQLCRLIISISRDINPGNCNVAVSQSSESFPQNSVISQFSRVIITSHHNVWTSEHWRCTGPVWCLSCSHHHDQTCREILKIWSWGCGLIWLQPFFGLVNCFKKMN